MPWTAVVCRGAARLRLIRSERPVHDFAVRIAGAKSLPAIAFFDQYAQAWRPWAPDSSAFAFVGTIGGMTGVRVQNLDDGEPLFLTEGEWVAWSAG